MLVNKDKRMCWIVDFAVSADYSEKKPSEKIDDYQKLARELKIAVKHEGDSDTNSVLWTWDNFQRIDKGTGRLRNKKKIEAIQTTSLLRSAKILEEFWKLEKSCSYPNSSGNCQLIIEWKTLKEVKNNINDNINDTHKFLWDFDIQTDHLISAWSPDIS